MDAIVLDGNQRSALAVVRSLGSKGISVTVGEEVNPSIASSSRYCSHSFVYPSPYKAPTDFMKALEEISIKNAGAILFPMTDVTMSEVLKNRASLPGHIHLPCVDHNRYAAASDKVRLFRLAKDLNLSIPRTLFSSDFMNPEHVVSESKSLGFPVVLKPADSRIRTAQGWMTTRVRYAQNAGELRSMLETEPFRSYPFLAQERIEGPGVGVFLLMHEGFVVASFAHRRIREKPPSGGVSVLCQSIRPPVEAMEAASTLMESLGWSGVAMVEFKWDTHTHSPKLMEVNARFWGSLQLAVSSGVDFPYLLFCLARGERIRPPNTYHIGLKSRWELGDLDHLLLRLKEKRTEPLPFPGAPSKRKALTDFLGDFFGPHIRHEVLRPDDAGPFFFEVKKYLHDIVF